MSYALTFDDLDSDQLVASTQSFPPFQHREQEPKYSDELVWLNDHFDAFTMNSHGRFEVYKYHRQLFQGQHWRELISTSWRNSNLDIPFNPRHAVNFIWDSIDARASMRSKRKSNLSFIPNDQSDISDFNNAKACKLLYRNRADEMNLDALHVEADQHVDLFGDAFIFCLWNPTLFDGKGDVEVRVVPPNRVIPQMRSDRYKLKDLDHIEFVEWVNVYALKAMYPEEADRIGSDDVLTEIDLLDGRNHDNETLVHYFFHKKTPYMPNGRYIIYTKDVILFSGDLGYEHGCLPVVRDGDIEIPERFWHQSFITQVEQLQRTYNNVYSSVVRDFGYNGPKWMVPAGSKVKQASLNPGHNLVEYKGMKAPELVAHNSTNYQNFDFLTKIKEDIYSFGKVYDISRGVVPQGVTANSALRFLDEQETRRSDLLFSKKSQRIIEVGNMMISVMAQFYKKDHARTVRTLGSNNQYLIKDFKGNGPDFKKISQVRSETASALPDTKSGRISAIVELNQVKQADPIFNRNEVIQMLDMGLDERFRNAATVAVTSAKEMIQSLLEGEDVAPIVESDDLLVYYSVFETFMQSMTYKRQVPDEIKTAFVTIMKTVEGFLYEKAKVNSKMLATISQMPYFPRFFTVDIPLAQLAMDTPPMPPEGTGADTSPLKELQKQTAESEGAT